MWEIEQLNFSLVDQVKQWVDIFLSSFKIDISLDEEYLIQPNESEIPQEIQNI